MIYLIGYLLIVSLVVGVSTNFISLNTFFFGYLTLKWRRLFRTLIIIGLVFFYTWLWWIEIYGCDRCDDLENIFSDIKTTLFSFFIFPPIALISWLIKPFVVNED